VGVGTTEANFAGVLRPRQPVCPLAVEEC